MALKPWIICGTLAAMTSASLCHADAEGAREVYQRGKVAYDRGDFGVAANAFAEADARSPNDRVLELAIASAHRANDPALGMTLVDRADERGLVAVAKAGRDRFAAYVGKIVVVCPDFSMCKASLDDRPLSTAKPNWATLGKHTATLTVDDDAAEISTVVVTATEIVAIKRSVRDVAPSVVQVFDPLPAAPAREPRARPSRAWFWGGVGTTALLGAGTLVSALDVRSIHDDFASNRSDELAAAGKAAETRTNVLLISTGIVAVATAVVGYFVFKPGGETRANIGAR